MKEFKYTPEGFELAKEYLKSIGRWREVSSGLDGYSIVHFANSILEKDVSK